MASLVEWLARHTTPALSSGGDPWSPAPSRSPRHGDQGGTLGFFEHQTPARWIAIAGPGSSIAPSLAIPFGDWVDYSGDADFADLGG